MRKSLTKATKASTDTLMMEEGRRPQDCQAPIDAGLAVIAKALAGLNDRTKIAASVKALAAIEWGAGKEVAPIVSLLCEYLDALEDIGAYAYLTGGSQAEPTVITYEACSEIVEAASRATVARTLSFALTGWEGQAASPKKVYSKLFEAVELAKKGRRNASRDEIASGKASEDGTVEYRHFASPWNGTELDLEGWKIIKEEAKDRFATEGKYVWTSVGARASNEDVSRAIIEAASKSRF